jgi:hypothetical protein
MVGPSLALVAAIGTAANSVAPICNQYSTLNRLPDSFEEIGRGDLGYAEVFVLSDGVCACDNTPSIDRRRGKPVLADVNWSCRAATSDERGDDR